MFGGGSDYPEWYRENGGEVVSFAIDKFCYLSARELPPFFNHRYRVVYSRVETTFNISEIGHPAIREGLKEFGPHFPLEIHHDGDLPARSGIGSSSAFAVGLIHTLLLLQKKPVSPEKLATEAIKLEREILKENVGIQDQIACSYGGLNHLTFGKENWRVSPIDVPRSYQEEIERRVVLVFTGVQRTSSDVQAELLREIESKSQAMNKSINLARQCRLLLEEKGDLDLVGEMLVEAWNVKRELNPFSTNSTLESIWKKSIAAGALGGKVIGAGGGGFFLFWVADGERENFLKRFDFGTHVPVAIENKGSTCIFSGDNDSGSVD